MCLNQLIHKTMESLRNEPVYLGGTPGAGGSAPTIINTPSNGNGYGEGGLLSTIVMASLLGGRGFGGRGVETCEPSASFAFAQRAADNSSQLLSTVTKAEGDIKEAFNAGLHRNQIENAAHFSNLNNRMCDAEKEAIKSGYEARIESLNTKSDLLANQNANTISIKDDIKDFRFANDKTLCSLANGIDKQFCSLGNDLERRFHHIEHVIDKRFDKLLERDYKEEIRQLRDQIDKQQFKSVNSDLNELQRDVNRILCGLGKIAPTNLAPNVLEGCCG